MQGKSRTRLEFKRGESPRSHWVDGMGDIGVALFTNRRVNIVSVVVVCYRLPHGRAIRGIVPGTPPTVWMHTRHKL